IIELEPSGHMLIKGVAGSGKTTVAIRRVSFLKEHFCPDEGDNILLVTFNKTLLKYMKHQYDGLENEDLQPSLFGSDAEVKINNIDKLMYAFYRKYLKRHKLSYDIVSQIEVRKVLQMAILK